MAKGNLDQQKQVPAVEAAVNVTPLATKSGENTSEVFLQLFDPTENIYSDITGKFPVQLDRGNNYILVAYHYYDNNMLTTPIRNRTGPRILNGIKQFMTNEVSGD